MLKTKRKNNLILVGLIALALCFSAVAVSLIHSTFFAVHANPVVEIVRNGSRISSKVEGISSPSYQWFMADATDGVVVGTFTKIESAAEPYLDLTSAQSNKAIKLVVSGNESNVIADIANVVVFDLAKGNVTFGTNYSGKDKDDNDLSAVHDKENIYIVQQSNNTTPTTHSIIVDSGTYDITIDGVNIGGLTPVQKTPGGGGIGNNSSAFIDIVSNQQGLAIGMRHITLSTCGIVPRIYDYMEREAPGPLAISLHAPNNELRNQLMPINRRYPVEELMTAVKAYIAKTNKKVMLEYVMLDGINDKPEHAHQLAALIESSDCHVNLIPYNATQNLGFAPSSMENIKIFYDILRDKGIFVNLRREFGASVQAACGQLKANYLKETNM